MAMEVTQSQYNTTLQPIRNSHLKVNLLNFNYQTVDSLEGNVVSGSMNEDGTSDMRRSCSVSLVVTDSSFDAQAGGKIFLDRLIQIYRGTDDVRTSKTIWTNKGIYLINQPSYQYDAVTHTLSFDGLDLMSLLTGARNGYLIGVTYKIPQGSSVKEAMIGTLKEAGFTKYVISDCVNTDGSVQAVPYDMEFTQGSTRFDILSKLRDILPNYQIYFDQDGVFHYETIPYDATAPIRVTDDLWGQNVISEQVNTDFEGVKNLVEVYGRTHDVSYYSSTTTLSGSTLSLTIASLTTLTEFNLIGWTTPSAVTGNIQLAVNSFGAKNLVDSNGNIITSLDKDTYYTAYYQSDGTWLFLGHLQAYGTWSDNNPDSPFYIGNPAGIIRIPLYGGDYDNIQSDELALERAKFEIYTRCRMNDTLTLTCVPIDWLEVNWMVTYTPLDGTVAKQYIIKSISTDFDVTGTQTVTLASFYPYYPVIS